MTKNNDRPCKICHHYIVEHLICSVDASAIIKEGKLLNGKQTKDMLVVWLENIGVK